MNFSSATSPKLVNAVAVLGFAWDREAFTASDAMVATGLTRSTVIGLCDELLELGWLTELADSRADGTQYLKGRPARRYALSASRAVVIGIDAGIHTVTTQVADLQGRVLSHASRSLIGPWPTASERVDAIEQGIENGLAEAGVTAAEVLCVVVGVPAPTDAQGNSPEGPNGFWRRMNPDLRARLDTYGWTTIIENDANLAAIGEGAVGAGVGFDCFITLLAGERFGSGCVVDGRLLRGSHGGAGESHPMALIDGVGEADGIGETARQWARQARDAGDIPADSALMQIPRDALNAEAVFRAADQGDPTALEIIGRISERLARICAVMGGLLDVDRIILAGGVAKSLDVLLEHTARRLSELMQLRPPELVASDLGSEVVTVGAVMRALAWGKDNLRTLVAESPSVAVRAVPAPS